MAVASGDPQVRLEALRSRADIVALGRDNLRSVPTNHRFKTVIMDESSSFKNRSTQRWKMMRHIVKDVDHRWALSGTPAPNGLMDLWAQLFLLDDGDRLGKSITMFRNRHFTPGKQLRTGVITDWSLRPGSDTRIHDVISDICLSMGTDGRISLPPVTTSNHLVPLPDPVKGIYKKLVRDLVVNLELLGGVHSAMNAAVLTGKLSQLTAGFLYHEDELGHPLGTYDEIHTAKIDALQDLVEAAMGSPVLVFYRFRAEMEMARRALPHAKMATDKGVLDAWNEGKVPVMLAHPASAGHGLNLQHGGHNIIWLSPSWSLEEDMQANRRLARQGQKHPVVIRYLVSPNTVDELVLNRLNDKTSVHVALMSYLESVL